jgi:MFS transporter, DHA1 family, multidrug resistance protein
MDIPTRNSYASHMDNPARSRFLDRTRPPHIATLVFITGMSAMVMNMFLPSLPTMTVYFKTDYRVMQLSVALYLVAVAVLQVFVGPLSDRFGRRPVLLIGLAVFLLATVGALLAPTVEVFLVFRMAQASVGVAMVLSRAIARDMFKQSEAASMIGYITMGTAVVPMISPAIGGALDEVFGWKASFYVFLIMGTIVFWLVWADVGETNARQSTSLRQQIREYPELLLSPRFWGYCLAAAFASGAFFAYLGGAPFIGTEVYGLPPSQLGIFFGAPALGYMSGNFLSGRYSTSIGVNRMVLWGTMVIVIGMSASLLLSLAGLGSVYTFFGFMVFVGLANGMVLPNSTAGMLSVRPHLAGTASGLGGSIMLGGGAALSALAGALLGPGRGPYPLLWIMLVVSLLSLASILLVIWREKVKGIA